MPLDTAQATVIRNDLTAKFDRQVMMETPLYPEISMRVDSGRREENYGFLGSMPGVREWLGDRQFHKLRAATYALKNKKWEDSLEIEKDDISDDSMGLYGPLIQELGTEAALHPDDLMIETIINGESELCFDGQFFFDNDHVWGDSGSLSNDLTYTVSDTAAVTSTEFKGAYHQARRKMQQLKNDHGNFLNRVRAGAMSNLVLLVPPELDVAAHEAIRAVVISQTSNIVLDAPRIVVMPQLTTSTKFYLLNLEGALKPFIFQAREPLMRDMKGFSDLETQVVKFMTQARYNIGYFAWWKANITTLST